ncbi:MAG: hypothetical protein R3B60_02960 [Candidatus Paceibacterota bacterium]
MKMYFTKKKILFFLMLVLLINLPFFTYFYTEEIWLHGDDNLTPVKDCVCLGVYREAESYPAQHSCGGINWCYKSYTVNYYKNFTLPEYIKIADEIELTDDVKQMITTYDQLKNTATQGFEFTGMLARGFEFEDEKDKDLFLQLPELHSSTTVNVPPSISLEYYLPPIPDEQMSNHVTLVYVNGSNLWFSQSTVGSNAGREIHGYFLTKIPFVNNNSQILIRDILLPYQQYLYGGGYSDTEPIPLSEIREKAIELSQESL